MFLQRFAKLMLHWLDLDELASTDATSRVMQQSEVVRETIRRSRDAEGVIITPTVGGGYSQPVAIHPHRLGREVSAEPVTEV